MTGRRMIRMCIVAVSLLVPAAAHAQMYTDIARGLYLAGFAPNVQRDPLTKGINATYSRAFFNNSLNYGVSTLTLTGGMTVQGSVAKRPFPGASFGIKSTSDPKGGAVPLTYTLTIPRAAEQITVSGNVTFNTSAKVDQTGYYSIVTNIENRGTVTTTGAVASTNNIDFNVGPISQTGNIYLKAVGGLVNALGGNGNAVAGLPNTGPLVSLDQYDLSKLDTDTLATMDPNKLNLDDPEQLDAYVNAVLLKGLNDAATTPGIGTTTTKMAPLNPVPEPSTLALLALCGGMTFFRARRRIAR